MNKKTLITLIVIFSVILVALCVVLICLNNKNAAPDNSQPTDTTGESVSATADPTGAVDPTDSVDATIPGLTIGVDVEEEEGNSGNSGNSGNTGNGSSNNSNMIDFDDLLKPKPGTQTTEPTTNNSDTNKPDTNKPDTNEPDTNEPDTNEPETTEPEEDNGNGVKPDNTDIDVPLNNEKNSD